MARFCVLLATGLTATVLLLWTLEPGATGRVARSFASAALAIPDEPDTAPAWRRPPRPESIVTKSTVQALPDVPGLRRWRDGHRRQQFLRPVKQPPDRRPLHRQRLWMAALQVFGHQDDAHEEDARVRRLDDALALAHDPLVRQNLIFLAVVSLPADRAHALLDPIAESGDEQDREDIYGAFAFSGEGEAFERYRALAAGPEAVSVRRLVDSVQAHNAIKDRRVLRSYRLIEALDRDLYFDAMSIHAPSDWLPPPRPDVGMTERLLHLWLARYPGHPGSDDMAYRLGKIALHRGDYYDAARWFSRASTWPDRHVRRAAPLHTLRAVAEFLLTRAEIDLLLNDEGLVTPNRQWLQYTRVRRAAVEDGFAYALELTNAVAASEPDSAVARAWVRRWAAQPPKGLDSGMAPLPHGDPLRAVAATAWPAPPRRNEDRLHPSREPVPIPVRKTARQFRVWETLAELERRAARASGDERTDLLYKQGAVFYHQAELALIPTYHRSRWGLWHATSALHRVIAKDERRRMEREFRESSFGHIRAIRIWEAIEARAQGYPAMDKAVFSQGLGWRHFLDFAYAAADEGDFVRPLVGAMERCASRFPDSPLADDATSAAGYWRKRAPRFFRR